MRRKTEMQKLIAKAKKIAETINKRFSKPSEKRARKADINVNRFYTKFEKGFKTAGVSGKNTTIAKSKIRTKKQALEVIALSEQYLHSDFSTEAGRKRAYSKSSKTFSERYGVSERHARKIVSIFNNESFKKLVESNRIGTDIVTILQSGVNVKSVIDFLDRTVSYMESDNGRWLQDKPPEDIKAFLSEGFENIARGLNLDFEQLTDFYR